MKQIRKRLTYANVMSSIAVFLVIGGATAFAAGHLGKNTVGTKQLKNNAVTTAKIKNGAVTGAKVNAASLGTVPSATNASHATAADNATNANNAKLLNGIGSTAFSLEASSAIDNNAIAGVTANITAREVNITVPQNGFLLAIASSDVFGSATDFLSCEFNVDGTNISASRRSIEITAENGEENCGTNAIAPVTVGKHNVKFNYSSRASTTTVDETELDVVFIPFSG